MGSSLLLVFFLIFWPVSTDGTTIESTIDVTNGNSLNGEGLWRNLGKFAVQEGSPFYFYGTINLTRDTGKPYSAVLALIPEPTWFNISHQLISKGDFHCPELIESLFNNTACFTKEQYFLRIPCVGTCIDQSNNTAVVPENQFTMVVQASSKTMYWFAVAVFCTACQGGSSLSSPPKDLEFSYMFTFVNSDPNSTANPFINQFPYNLHYILVTFLIFTCLYILLVAVHFILHSRLCNTKTNTHLMIILFSLSLILESLNILFGLIHYSLYAYDGVGFVALYYLMEFFNLLADWILILVFVLIAGGWQVTTRLVYWKKVSFLLWTIYVIISGIFFIWEVVEHQVNPFSTTPILQTWAGIVYLAYRSLLLFYVWYQLWHTYRQEDDRPKLMLYVFLGVILTVWFWYLPIVVLIVSFVNHVISGLITWNIVIAMNFFIKVAFVFLLCPRWSDKYFQFHSHINSLASFSAQMWNKDYTQITSKVM